MKKFMFSDGTCVTADSKEEAKDIFKKSSEFTKQIAKKLQEVCTEGAKVDSDFQGKGTIAKFIRTWIGSNTFAEPKITIKCEGSIQEDLTKSTIDISVKMGDQLVITYNITGNDMMMDLEEDLNQIINFVTAFKQLINQ